MYRPPSGNIQLFQDIMTEFMEQAALYGDFEMFLIGDFNIDLADLENVNASSLVENLQQKIKNPTRHAKNKNSSLIHHIYTNSEHAHESGCITLNISDHDLVYVIWKKDKPTKVQLSFRGRSYRHYDREQFQDNLANLDWQSLYVCNDIDQAWNIMLEKIRYEIELMCPLKNIKINKQKDPWITNEILELINDKNDLLAGAKCSKLVEDWDNAQTARNLVSSMIKEAKRDYLTNEIGNNHDPNKFWNRLHSMFPDKPTSGKINLKNSNTNEMLKENDIPDYANTFFTSVGSNIICDTGFDIRNWSYEGIKLPQTFVLREVEIEKVLYEIKNIKATKPSVIDHNMTLYDLS